MITKVAQSYIYYEDKLFYISTINRQSSAMITDPPWYTETFVWELDPNNPTNVGDLVHESSSNFMNDITSHFETCMQFFENGKANKEDE
jgi:hypothetical protein